MVETQETIGRWARATFPGGDDHSPRHCLRLLEEVGELCRAAGASKRKILDTITLALRDGSFRKLDPPEKIAEELADVAIVLAVIAHRRGVDLQAEVDRKMAVNRYEREWVANGDGTGYHKKKTQGITVDPPRPGRISRARP
jgi:NTP pyrophosphatase (non-canonical NTP hydrolase)